MGTIKYVQLQVRDADGTLLLLEQRAAVSEHGQVDIGKWATEMQTVRPLSMGETVTIEEMGSERFVMAAYTAMMAYA